MTGTDGKIFALGGNNGSGTALDTVEVYKPATGTARITAISVRQFDGSAITRPLTVGAKVHVAARISFTPNDFDPSAWVTVTQGQSRIGETGLGMTSLSEHFPVGTATFQGTVPVFPAHSGHVTLTVGFDVGPESAKRSTTIPVQVSTRASRRFSLRVSISPSVIQRNSLATLVVHTVPGAVCRAPVPEATGYFESMVDSRGRLDWQWKAAAIGRGKATVRCSYLVRSEKATVSFTVV